METIVRAQVAHVPGNPFVDDGALEAFEDGAVSFADGRILACGDYGSVRGRYPEASVVDARDAILLPGFVDCHVHYPQIGVIGAMGLELMDWLRERSLPEEARLAEGSTHKAVLQRSESLEAALGAVFTLAREESIAEAWVAGRPVWPVTSVTFGGAG